MLKIKSFLNLFRKRRFILIFVILAILGIVIFNQTRSRSQTLQEAAVKRQDIKSTVSVSGTLTGKNTLNLHFKSSGKLSFLNVKIGNHVETGNLIASLDTADLNISLQQAKNNLADKQATLDKVLDDIHLFQYGNGGFTNIGTPNETMSQRAARIIAEQAVNNAFDSVKTAELAFQDITIFSPISGTVTKADFLPGQVVSPTDIIAQVIDDNELYFDAEVDESDISKVTLGQKAQVTLNAYPDRKFTGEVTEIKSITKTAISGATVIIVRILLDAPNVAFISSLNGQSDIEVDRIGSALTIPIDSLVDEKYVYVQKGNSIDKREVKVGISSDTAVEIKTGLSENEKVVTNPGNVANK